MDCAYFHGSYFPSPNQMESGDRPIQNDDKSPVDTEIVDAQHQSISPAHTACSFCRCCAVDAFHFTPLSLPNLESRILNHNSLIHSTTHIHPNLESRIANLESTRAKLGESRVSSLESRISNFESRTVSVSCRCQAGPHQSHGT